MRWCCARRVWPRLLLSVGELVAYEAFDVGSIDTLLWTTRTHRSKINAEPICDLMRGMRRIDCGIGPLRAVLAGGDDVFYPALENHQGHAVAEVGARHVHFQAAAAAVQAGNNTMPTLRIRGVPPQDLRAAHHAEEEEEAERRWRFDYEAARATGEAFFVAQQLRLQQRQRREEREQEREQEEEEGQQGKRWKQNDPR